MEAIRIFVNGKPEGIMGIRDKKEAMDLMLDELSKATNESTRKDMLSKMDIFSNEKNMIYIPKGNKPFDWNENIHGKWIINKSN